MLLSALGASLLWNILTGRRIYRAGKDKGKGVLRAGYGNNSNNNNNNNKMDF